MVRHALGAALLATAVSIVVAWPVVSPATPVIRYAAATTHLGAYDQSGRYGAPLLFDGDDRTAWCEGAPGAGIGERVGLEFTRPIRADRVRIALGESQAFGRFVPANRVRALTITNLRYAWQIKLPDSAEPFEVALPPPVTGRQLVLRIDEVHDHQARHTCLAEVTFFEGSDPLTLVPSGVGTCLPAADAPTVEGVWAPREEPDPEIFLVFYRDGPFQARLHPNATGAVAARTAGIWRVRNSRGAANAFVLAFEDLGTDETRDAAAHLDPPSDGRPVLVLDGVFTGAYTPWVPDPG